MMNKYSAYVFLAGKFSEKRSARGNKILIEEGLYADFGLCSALFLMLDRYIDYKVYKEMKEEISAAVEAMGQNCFFGGYLAPFTEEGDKIRVQFCLDQAARIATLAAGDKHIGLPNVTPTDNV